MKLLSTLLCAGLILAASIAQADVNPTLDRPVLGAELTEIIGTKPVDGQRAFYMTKNLSFSTDEALSFTMHEDTGIRCVTTPCPSTREVKFLINDLFIQRHGETIRYEATEVLTNSSSTLSGRASEPRPRRRRKLWMRSA